MYKNDFFDKKDISRADVGSWYSQHADFPVCLHMDCFMPATSRDEHSKFVYALRLVGLPTLNSACLYVMYKKQVPKQR